MIKKILVSAVNAISIAIIVFAVAVLCIVVLTPAGQTPSILGHTVLRVVTGSMEPGLPVDTLIVVRKTDPSKIEEGDIISFYSSDPSLGGAVNTHRVVSSEIVDGEYVFTTKGDANVAPDNYPVAEKYLIGKVVFSSLALGKVSRLSSNPLIFIPFILIPLAILLIVNLVQTIKVAKETAREEEEQAVREAIEEIKKKKMKENSTDEIAEVSAEVSTEKSTGETKEE